MLTPVRSIVTCPGAVPSAAVPSLHIVKMGNSWPAPQPLRVPGAASRPVAGDGLSLQSRMPWHVGRVWGCPRGGATSCGGRRGKVRLARPPAGTLARKVHCRPGPDRISCAGIEPGTALAGYCRLRPWPVHRRGSEFLAGRSSFLEIPGRRACHIWRKSAKASRGSPRPSS